MIQRLIDRLILMVRQSMLITKLRNKRLFPGVAIHATVNMAVEGHFICDDGIINSWSQIIVPAGATLALGNGCYIGRNVELGPVGTIRIGSRTSIQDRCIILGDVQIGAYCVFAPNIFISSGRHHFDGLPWSLIKDQDEQAAVLTALENLAARKVVIEDDCWIGVNAVVMRGVKISKGAVIGANAVVTEDVAPYTVVAGAPARVLRKRLNFQPPKAVCWDADEHMPYFYGGFQVSLTERSRNAAMGGLAVSGSACSLALTAGVGDQLVVTARLSQMVSNVYLRSGRACHALSADFCDLAFPISGNTSLHLLEIIGIPSDSEASVVLQSARCIQLQRNNP